MSAKRSLWQPILECDYVYVRLGQTNESLNSENDDSIYDDNM